MSGYHLGPLNQEAIQVGSWNAAETCNRKSLDTNAGVPTLICIFEFEPAKP